MLLKNCWYNILHTFGCISFPRLIFPYNIDIYNETAAERYFDSLVSYEQLFTSLRYYSNLYYSTKDNPIPSTIFDVIEEIHGNHKKSHTEKIETFRDNWMELVVKECYQQIYIAPLLFGFTEMLLILCIKAIIIYIIFSNYFNININTEYWTNYIFNLSIALISIVILHIIGNIYQLNVSENIILNSIVWKAKNKTKSRASNGDIHYNERFIGVQKWYNLMIINFEQQYNALDIWKLLFEKYIFLFIIVCIIITICCVQNELNFLFDDLSIQIEVLYISVQIIILPLWFVGVTIGLKRCFSCKVFNCTFLIVILTYIASFSVLCMHYYNISFLNKIKFASYLFDNTLWMRWSIAFNMGLNGAIILYLLFCMKPYQYLRPHTHLRYYVISLLLIYQIITLKQFFNVFGYWLSTPIQFILTIAIYIFISISNFVYFGIIHVEYYAKNDINFADYDGLKYSFYALFCWNTCQIHLNTYSTPDYAKDWLRRLAWHDKRHNTRPERSDATMRQSRLLF